MSKNIEEYNLVHIDKLVSMEEAIAIAEEYIEKDEKAFVVFKDVFVYKQPATKRLAWLASKGNKEYECQWDINVYADKVTIFPSIKTTHHDSLIEHYWIKDSKVVWCRDSYIFKKEV